MYSYLRNITEESDVCIVICCYRKCICHASVRRHGGCNTWQVVNKRQDNQLFIIMSVTENHLNFSLVKLGCRWLTEWCLIPTAVLSSLLCYFDFVSFIYLLVWSTNIVQLLCLAIVYSHLCNKTTWWLSKFVKEKEKASWQKYIAIFIFSSTIH